jgi:uncharacterized membrane protein (DUF485 family)
MYHSLQNRVLVENNIALTSLSFEWCVISAIFILGKKFFICKAFGEPTMNSNRNNANNAYLASIIVLLITVVLGCVFFLLGSKENPATWQELGQGVSGNIIATTISFLVVYIFIDRIDAFGHSKTTYQWIADQIDLVVNRLNGEFLSSIESQDSNSNRYFESKIDSLKSDLALNIQQMGRDLGGTLNTKLDLDSNDPECLTNLSETAWDQV